MRGFVANTDYDWFRFLEARSPLDEVNFWLPSERQAFRAVPPGSPLFLRLKKPHHAIAGFGIFVGYSRQPAWLAWQSFGEANGAPTLATMMQRIEKYRKAERRDPYGRYEVGCVVLVAPVFFAEELWVAQPSGWASQIVKGKGFDLEVGEGARIWRECQERAQLVRPELFERPAPDLAEPANRFGAAVLVRPRLGQGAFRLTVTDAYGSACAVTKEHSLPVLDAAHIQPFARGGAHTVNNGLLLRTDIHRLFDEGYVTLTDDYRFEVSQRLKLDYDNGRSYYGFAGNPVHLPSHRTDWPARELIQWHQSEVYLG